MKINEAIAEAERWLAYLDQQEEKARQMADIARRRRSGELSYDEGKREMHRLDHGAKVYDGANLAAAVRVLIATQRREQ